METESPVGGEDATLEAPAGIEHSPDGASAEPDASEPYIGEPEPRELEPGEPDGDGGEQSVEAAAAGEPEPEPERAAATGDEAAKGDAAPVVAVASVRFVSQNILHGAGCPAGSDSCQVGERVSLFMAQLAAAGCPELVSVQEANERIVSLVSGEAGICGYELVWDDDPGLDREVVLTTLEVIGSQRRVLADRFRSAYLVRVSSPIGVIDFLTTHLASGGDDRDCNPELCPPPCDAAGRLRTCQARQVLEFARQVALDGAVTVVGGDLNDSAGSPALAVFDEAGFVDSHLAAGHPECDPGSGTGCTAGRDDTTLAGMADPSSPSSRQSSRIDYLLYSVPGRDCSVGEATGLFNAEPAAGDLAFPSDHTAVALELVCDAAGGDRVDAGHLDPARGSR